METRRRLLFEDFEGTEFPPPAWTEFGISWYESIVSWEVETEFPYSGARAARILGESSLLSGDFQDWLVTRAIDLSGVTAPQLRFYARKVAGVDHLGSSYRVYASSESQTDSEDFTELASWTTSTLLGGQSYDVYREKVINLPASMVGKPEVYLSFVHASNGGIGWIIDDIVVIDRCAAR